MVPNEEIDLLIELWPSTWKKGIPSTPASVTAKPKDNPPQPHLNTNLNPVATTTPPPPSTKQVGPSTSGPRKKQQAHCEHYDATVTLTGGDLEQITNAVTMAIEDKWALIVAQSKAWVESL